MRISINLATRPFVELRPLLARLRLAMGVLAVIAIGLAIWAQSLSVKAAVATAQMDALKRQTAAVSSVRVRNEHRMNEPSNRGILERAHFLNALFARKSFSWTAVMMDLERVLPNAVQVTSIEPNITKEGDVIIRLRVTGDRDRAIQLVRNLETSQRFAGPRLSGETAITPERAKALAGVPAAGFPGAPAAGLSPTLQTISSPTGSGVLALGNGVEFEIFSGYIPLAERVAEKRKQSASADGGSALPDDRVAPLPQHDRRPSRLAPNSIPGSAPVPRSQAHKPSADNRVSTPRVQGGPR